MIQTRRFFSFLLLLVLTFSVLNGNSNQTKIDFEKLPDLPASEIGAQQFGLAGGFAGIHNGVMIFAGGANFPEAAPWEGGTKIWWQVATVVSSGPPMWRRSSGARQHAQSESVDFKWQ